jgi:hypothetical protein
MREAPAGAGDGHQACARGGAAALFAGLKQHIKESGTRRALFLLLRCNRMKKRIIWDDYTFYIDIDKAESFYSDAPQVFDCLSGYLPDLTRFLASLGIDIEKPLKYDLSDTSDLLYKTFGTFVSKTGYELDFYGEGKYVSVVIFSRENMMNVEVFGIMR